MMKITAIFKTIIKLMAWLMASVTVGLAVAVIFLPRNASVAKYILDTNKKEKGEK